MKKLTISQRKDLKKGTTNQIRREGNVPGVIYGRGRPNESIVVNGSEFQAVMRGLEKGLLATTRFELHDGNQKRKAIVKDIHYHPVSYAVTHVDFAELDDQRAVSVNVPILVVGMADCAGIKLGGFLRQVLRSVEVECLPKDIPSAFTIDVRELSIGDAKRISDIAMPASVRARGNLDQVAIVIAKSKA